MSICATEISNIIIIIIIIITIIIVITIVIIIIIIIIIIIGLSHSHIFLCVRYGWTEAIDKLMDRQNARILNLQNSQGKTALHYACSEGHDLPTEALLKLGATVERYSCVFI